MWCLRSLFTGEYWYSSLWAENTQSTRPCPQERTPGVVPNLLPFVIRKSVLGMSKSFSQKRYRSNHLVKSVTVQISLIFLFFFSLKESITELISTLKSRWIWIRTNELSLVFVMVARRNALILFMELKDLSAVAVVTVDVKRTVRMKEMFGYNSASKASNIFVNVLGGFCSPDQRAFQRLHSISNASITIDVCLTRMLDYQLIIRSHFVQIRWN